MFTTVSGTFSDTDSDSLMRNFPQIGNSMSYGKPVLCCSECGADDLGSGTAIVQSPTEEGVPIGTVKFILFCFHCSSETKGELSGD